MGLFVCSKCNCVENTSLGHYWDHNRPENYDWNESNKEFKGKPLCSECAPKTYSDTHEPTGFGKWHGRFPKRNINEIPEKGRSNIYNT